MTVIVPTTSTPNPSAAQADFLDKLPPYLSVDTLGGVLVSASNTFVNSCFLKSIVKCRVYCHFESSLLL